MSNADDSDISINITFNFSGLESTSCDVFIKGIRVRLFDFEYFHNEIKNVCDEYSRRFELDKD